MPNMSSKSNNPRRVAYIVAALLVLIALTAGAVYARYATSFGQTKGSVSSPDFYFSSDLLFQSPGTTYTLNQGSGGSTDFTFEVRNYVDALRINEKDIEVTIAVTSDNSAALEGVTVSQSTITLTGGAKNSAPVTVSGLKNGETYTITATGDAGFKATLSAIVTVKPGEPDIYMHLQDENDYYVLLTVWTKNLSGTVSITYPDGLIPDATDPVMAVSAGTIGDPGVYFVTKTVTDVTNFGLPYSSHVYRFFKETPGAAVGSGFGASIDHDGNNGTPDIAAIPAIPE